MQYGAVILRSQSVTVIFRMTYECHTSLAHCHCTHPAPLLSGKPQPFSICFGVSVEIDWSQRQRDCSYCFSPPDRGPLGRMGRSLPEEPCFSLRAAPDLHSQSRPRGSVSQLTEAFLSGLAFVSEILRRPQMGLARMDVSDEAVMRIEI